MRRWREIALIAALFGALILFTVYGPGRGTTDTQDVRGSTHSTGDNGALALQRWLATIGYAAPNLEYNQWRIPDDAHALLILNPTKQPILDAEAQEIVRWVRAGGTLIAIDEQPQSAFASNRLWPLLEATTVVTHTGVVTVERATATQPLLMAPPVTSVPVKTANALTLKNPGYVTVLQTRFGPTLVGRQEGRGYLYLGVAAHPFTNAGLREPGSAGLVLNLLARVPRGGTVLFDEYHHGFARAPAGAPSLRRIALGQWWGWAAVYSLAVVGLYIVLTGRRFGRPVPLQRDVARRSSAEYVQSMADLLQRAHKQQPVAQHFHDGLKRRLARAYGIAAEEDDELFVRRLFNTSNLSQQQAAALRQVLEELRRPGLGDADLVRLVRTADDLAVTREHIR
jgi:hypothetical protein